MIGGKDRGKGTLTISLRTNKKLRPFASSFFEFIASYFIDTVQGDEHEGKPLQTKNSLHQREKFLANKKSMVNVISKNTVTLLDGREGPHLMCEKFTYRTGYVL